MIDPRAHATIQVTVDIAVLTVRDGSLQVLLVERGNRPYAGRSALPGGFPRVGEDLDSAAIRELLEETRLGAEALHLRQLAAFGAPDRDPRGHVVTVAYLGIAPNLPVPLAGTDATGARWAQVDPASGTIASLAFDHTEILRLAVERARRELEYTTIATAFCADTFTVGELRNVYEIVWGRSLDERNFSRKVKKTRGFVIPTGERRAPALGRPAALYQRGPATTLYPPMLRPDGEPGHSG